MQRVGEALDQPLLHLAVAGEDDERLVRREEVLDPRQRGAELAARGEPAQRVELREPLGAQRRGDLRSSSRRSSGCSRSQAMTSRSASRYSRSLSSATGTTTWRFSGSCGSTSALARRTKQRAAQVPVDALLGAGALEAALEPRAGAELLQPADDPQLRDQLVRVVHHRRAGQASCSASGGARREPAHGLRALGPRVLDVVRLVQDERLRAASASRSRCAWTIS